MRITISEDTTFLICDELGNVPEGAELGLYHEDTRFLCGYELEIDGQVPLLLSSRATDYYACAHFLTNPALATTPRGWLSIVRRRLVGQGMHEDLDITNDGDRSVAFMLDLRFDADFADIFQVKRNVEVQKETIRRFGSFRLEVREQGRSLRFSYERGQLRRLLVVNLSRQPEFVDGRCRFAVDLEPRQSWHLCVDFLTVGDQEHGEPSYTCRRSPSEEARLHRERRHADLVGRAPAVGTDSYVLQRAYQQSVHDFAALRIKGEHISSGEFVVAAGIPWFMALFGRDSLIAAYQALPFYPEAARGVLHALARLQGSRVNRRRAEEPGKIVHEYRYGTFAEGHRGIPAFPYYGSIDATPLFLMLLAAVYRLTGDLAFVRSLRENALRALDWMDRYGDRDGDGYLEYLRETEAGLENQGWKDSFDAVRFRDGQVARPPIALCEVQGYAYAARVGMADVFEALGEPEQAAALRGAAARLKEQFSRDFWLPDRGYFAEALDGEKRPVDSLTSNPGHLLWTGIADGEKARQVAERLLSPALFSGWGVRTMAMTEGAYSPISYHNGSVWPHDNSLIVAGLARYGFLDEAAQVVAGLLGALGEEPDYRLPELLAGYSRREAPFPVEYPTASRPQAWAAGSVFLMLTAMAGLDVDAPVPHRWGDPFLPANIGRLCIDGLWVGQERIKVEVVRAAEGVARHIERSG